MSQHLITEFINRTYVFKPFNDAKIINHKVKKFQGSNRNNNVSPEMFEENTHGLHEIRVKKVTEDKKTDKQQADDQQKHIDITV